jgi:hypothetical protein
VGDERDRRSIERGRRDDDRELDWIIERLRRLEDRFEREIDQLESDNERLREAINTRVGELEEFHIREQGRANERTAQAVRRARFISSAGAASGALGVAFAIAEHFAHI